MYIVTLIPLTAFDAGLCGSQSMTTLLVCRFFAGVFGCSSMTSAGGLISDIFAAAQRGLAMGVFGAMPWLGPVVGPIVSGELTPTPPIGGDRRRRTTADNDTRWAAFWETPPDGDGWPPLLLALPPYSLSCISSSSPRPTRPSSCVPVRHGYRLPPARCTAASTMSCGHSATASLSRPSSRCRSS